MKVYIIVCAAFILSSCSSADIEIANPKTGGVKSVSLEEYCASNNCRKNRRVKFLTNGEPVDQLLETYWPVVQGENISLLPGDKIYVEAEVIDGLITKLKQVESISAIEKTITFDFIQMEEKQDMMLSVKNPFDKVMKFHIDMIDFSGNSHQTSSCPVISNGSVFEHWPHAIPEIIISNIRAMDMSDSMICIY